jgi:hypothetical protein
VFGRERKRERERERGQREIERDRGQRERDREIERESIVFPEWQPSGKRKRSSGICVSEILFRRRRPLLCPFHCWKSVSVLPDSERREIVWPILFHAKAH